MKAELPEGTTSTPSTAVATPDNASTLDQPISAEASESSNGSGEETLAQSSSASVKSRTSNKGKYKAKHEPEEKALPKDASADNLVGKINNLVTTDLSNIVDARDFLLLCKIPLSNLTCILTEYSHK